MTVFIIAVLLAACFQSFGKLSIPERKWEFLTAALLIPLPFLFEPVAARTGMQALNTDLSNAATLENWCALVVIQELLALTAGFSLLEETACPVRRKQGLRRWLGYWKYLVFLPSGLLPAGVMYLQMYLFNTLPGIEFRTLTWLLAAGLPVAAILLPESLRLIRRNPEDRILTVLHAEYFLLIPAVFLPVAAGARLVPGGKETAPADTLAVLTLLAGFTAAAGLCCKLFESYKKQRKKRKCRLQLKF